MGQLEKYGLYVLCLVIFLILGVTIWGGGDLPQPPRRPAQGSSTELNANPRGPAANPSTAGTVATRSSGPATPAPDVLSLLQPVAPPQAKKNDVKPVDASAQKPTVDAGKTPVVVGTAPGTAPADAGKPPVEAPRPTHKVARGDTFDSIAKEKLGSASLRTEIARLNPSIDPVKLKAGQELKLPTAAEVAALQAKSKGKAAPDQEPVGAKKATAEPGTYTIAKGDTFEVIARRELGSSKRVNELRELNADIDPTKLRIGMTIRLPKK